VTGNDPKNEKRNDAWIHIQYCTVYLGGIIIYHFVSSKCKQRYFFQVSQERTNIFEMLFFLRNLMRVDIFKMQRGMYRLRSSGTSQKTHFTRLYVMGLK
jgi:hypothetical protein